jgi:hypothetical protein
MTNPLEGNDAYPLSWPTGWARTPAQKRQNSAFADRSLAKARDFMLNELRLLGARNVTLSTNVVLRMDGLPYSGKRAPQDPGVAVYFTLSGSAKVLACDKWLTVIDNLWAIGKHISAIRGQARYGVGTIDQAFQGYAALPAPAVDWWAVLGVSRGADIETIAEAYHQAAKRTHPDAGGDHDAFLKVQAAFDQAKKEKAA